MCDYNEELCVKKRENSTVHIDIIDPFFSAERLRILGKVGDSVLVLNSPPYQDAKVAGERFRDTRGI